MDEKIISIWTEDSRLNYGRRKVIFEIDNIEQILALSLGVPHSQLKNFGSSKEPKLFIYLGADDFSYRNASTHYKLESSISRNQLQFKANVCENIIQYPGYLNEAHYVWNRLFDLKIFQQPVNSRNLRLHNDFNAVKNIEKVFISSIIKSGLDEFAQYALNQGYSRIEIK